MNPTSNVQIFPDIMTPTSDDYYRFTLSHRSSFNLSLIGTGAGISHLVAINTTGNDAVASLTNVNGSLFFTANDGSTRIWKSDGTAAGTVPSSSSFTGITPHNFIAVGNRLFFTAKTTTTGEELFVL